MVVEGEVPVGTILMPEARDLLAGINGNTIMRNITVEFGGRVVVMDMTSDVGDGELGQQR